jgi:hypothetical protein
MTASAEAFQSIVLDGAYLDKGMASFGEVLSASDAESIRAFIARQANQ